MSRVKSATQRAPQTTEAATELLARFAHVDAQIASTNAQRDESKAQIDAAADACLVPLLAERADIFAQLKPWFAANVEQLTGGKRRSIELAGCQLGYRLTPPKVAFEHGKDADAIEAAAAFGWGEILRQGKVTLDKPAVLKRLDGELDDDLVPLELIGFSAKQDDEFFVDRITSAPIAGTTSGS